MSTFPKDNYSESGDVRRIVLRHAQALPPFGNAPHRNSYDVEHPLLLTSRVWVHINVCRLVCRVFVPPWQALRGITLRRLHRRCERMNERRDLVVGLCRVDGRRNPSACSQVVCPDKLQEERRVALLLALRHGGVGG